MADVSDHVRTYQVTEAVSGEYCHSLLGAIPFDFAAGAVVPVSEHEELVLEELLVPAGMATTNDEPRRFLSLVGLSAGKVPEGTVTEIEEWVGDDVERAAAAREAELEGKRRSSLLNHLDLILQPSEPAAADASPDAGTDTDAGVQ